MRRGLPPFVFALVALFATMAPAHAQTKGIPGTYRAEGMNPDGKPYRAVVEIEANGDTFLVRWLERAGVTAGVGVGIIRDNALSVSYIAGRQLGIVVYAIETGPVLTGRWTVLGADGGLYPETLTKMGVAAEREDDHSALPLASLVEPPAIPSGPVVHRELGR
jgi:hypothetical protein